jgi:hypothetical protein
MFTILACPKPFENTHIATIQRNAITSWTLLKPRPEIILFGDEAGVAEICRDLGLRHVPDIVRNEFGTPLLNDIFQKGQNLATWPVVCYINADVILLDDFKKIIEVVSQIDREFLVVGQRWDLDIAGPIDFSSPTWAEDLRILAKIAGQLHPPEAIDYFVFSKGFFIDVPPFAIGRFYWDWWLISHARKRRALVIDATPSVTVVHQNHSYFHLPGGAQWLLQSEEVKRNEALLGAWHHWSTVAHADHVLRQGRIERAGVKRLLCAKIRVYRRLLLVSTAPIRHRIGLHRRMICRALTLLQSIPNLHRRI